MAGFADDEGDCSVRSCIMHADLFPWSQSFSRHVMVSMFTQSSVDCSSFFFHDVSARVISTPWCARLSPYSPPGVTRTWQADWWAPVAGVKVILSGRPMLPLLLLLLECLQWWLTVNERVCSSERRKETDKERILQVLKHGNHRINIG